MGTRGSRGEVNDAGWLPKGSLDRGGKGTERGIGSPGLEFSAALQ